MKQCQSWKEKTATLKHKFSSSNTKIVSLNLHRFTPNYGAITPIKESPSINQSGKNHKNRMNQRKKSALFTNSEVWPFLSLKDRSSQSSILLKLKKSFRALSKRRYKTFWRENSINTRLESQGKKSWSKGTNIWETWLRSKKIIRKKWKNRSWLSNWTMLILNDMILLHNLRISVNSK